MKKVIKQNGQIISAPTRLTINLTGADILAFQPQTMRTVMLDN